MSNSYENKRHACNVIYIFLSIIGSRDRLSQNVSSKIYRFDMSKSVIEAAFYFQVNVLFKTIGPFMMHQKAFNRVLRAQTKIESFENRAKMLYCCGDCQNETKF